MGSLAKAVSDDRYVALNSAGYKLISTMMSPRRALLSRESFGAVIIGHRFEDEAKFLLPIEAKEKWDTPVALVCGAEVNSEIPAMRRAYALEGNAGLVAALLDVVPVCVELGRVAA